MKNELLKKEEQLLIDLREQSLRMLEKLKANNQNPDFDFDRARYVIQRIFHNELDYLNREPDDYYELYMDTYYSN
jgi:hypothetical protein